MKPGLATAGDARPLVSAASVIHVGEHLPLEDDPVMAATKENQRVFAVDASVVNAGRGDTGIARVKFMFFATEIRRVRRTSVTPNADLTPGSFSRGCVNSAFTPARLTGCRHMGHSKVNLRSRRGPPRTTSPTFCPSRRGTTVSTEAPMAANLFAPCWVVAFVLALVGSLAR